MISRQRRWQIKKVQQGLCQIDGTEPVYKDGRCKAHYIISAYRKRIHSRSMSGYKAWAGPGNVGRPFTLEEQGKSRGDETKRVAAD